MERRKHNRADIKAFADVFDKDNKLVSRAEVCNVSLDGTAILTPNPLEIGSEVMFNILQRESKKIRILIENLAGKVIRIEQQGSLWLHGVIFKEVEKKNITILDDISKS